MSSCTRAKFDPGGVADFRWATWQRLEELQPEHHLDRGKRCLQENYSRRLQQSYLNEIQRQQCCPYNQSFCQGQQCIQPCTEQRNFILFGVEPYHNISSSSNPHHRYHHEQQHIPPQVDCYHQINHHPSFQHQQLQNERHSFNAMNPHYEYLNHRREQQRLQHRLQNIYQQQHHYNPQHQQQHCIPQLKPNRKLKQQNFRTNNMGPTTTGKTVYRQGMEYCMNQFPIHPHDMECGVPSNAISQSETPKSSCPPQRPRDIMEPRHYLLAAETWKGVPLPFNDSRYELLLPGDRPPMNLLPSANPFVYVGRKSNWTEPRIQNPPVSALPISARRPEVFGDGSGVAVTTNRLGYRAQRRHYKEPVSMIVYN